MDDHMAATPFSGDNLTMIGNTLRQSVGSFRGMPLGEGVSEQDRAANAALRAEVGRVMRERPAAYWLTIPMTCLYQTTHGEPAPADRLCVASYRSCVALLMVDTRRFVEHALLPRHLRSATSDKRRWVYNGETWSVLTITIFAVVYGLGEVVLHIRANLFGTLNEERFSSCIRRVCKSNDHYLHVMNMFRLTLTISAIRKRLGFSPDLGEGSKRQKHGDVLYEPTPRGYDGIPVHRVLSLALTAMIPSGVFFPAACLETWARLDVLVPPYSEPCFIEHLCHHQQRTSTGTCYSLQNAHGRVR
jgi:hypothetical protein